MNVDFKYERGDRVVHAMHSAGTAGFIGMVVAMEFYETGAGTSIWYYVRWMEPHGKLDSEPMKMSTDEIRPFRLRE